MLRTIKSGNLQVRCFSSECHPSRRSVTEFFYTTQRKIGGIMYIIWYAFLFVIKPGRGQTLKIGILPKPVWTSPPNKICNCASLRGKHSHMFLKRCFFFSFGNPIKKLERGYKIKLSVRKRKMTCISLDHYEI